MFRTFIQYWLSLRYLRLRKYVICSCIQQSTTEEIVTVYTSGSRLVWQIEERTWASTVCNKIYNFHFSAYFKLFARSETKDHLSILQVKVFLSDFIGFKRYEQFLRIFFSNIHRILFGSFSGQGAEPLRIHAIIVLLHYICPIILFNNLTNP